MSAYSEGLACVRTKSGKYGKYGYIDKKGKMVIKAKYDDAYSFSDGLAKVRHGNKVQYINQAGKVKISKKIKNDDSDYIDFSEGLASFYQKNKFGYIDKKGKTAFILNASVTYADDFYEGMSIVYDKKGKIGYINNKGKIVIQPKYTDASIFQEGLAYVKVKNKYGFINKKGKTVVKPVYDRVSMFCNGLAYVEKNGKAFYIDKTGKKAIVLP